MKKDFLPVNKDDMKKRGWNTVDFVFITGDAYVDHPSFGHAVISRVLESHGYKVGIIPQPDWNNPESITTFGKPNLGFLVSGGNMDTMVMHYTAAKKKRNFDYYTPKGEIGKRPDRATIVYCNLIRRTYKTSPIIIGGIEASLRRLAHYDYWNDKIRRSILIESGADILSYGMGEKSIVSIADCLSSGLNINDITYINGTVYRTKDIQNIYDAIVLPTFEEITSNKKTFAESFKIQHENTDPFSGKRLIEKYTDTEYIIQNPPSKPLSAIEIDDVYALPYMRDAHPMYGKDGIPAINEVKFSITSHRGCYGGCNFCALTFHQGRIIQPRSHESIINEAVELTKDKDFKGYINDVGGPTANFRKPACKKQLTEGACKNRQCLYPTPCKNLEVDHLDYVSLLRKLRKLKNIKKIFIRSGIRFDYLMLDKNDTFINELCRYHISGQLKVAPEHISNNVLPLMGKPNNTVYKSFIKKYTEINKKAGLNQYVVPYLMSSHPGSTLNDAIALAEHLNENNINPEQVQDFYPTPSTISTCMYYTGYDPRTMEKVYVARSYKEKAMQRALLQFKNPDNYDLVYEALKLANRNDLIGFDKKCLIPPRKIKNNKKRN